MVCIAQSEMECQVGYLRVRFTSKRLRFLALTISSYPCHSAIFFFFFWLKESDFLTMFCFSAMLADKNQVTPRLSFTNVAALNFLLRSEIFVSEDKQLRAVHLILEFESISKIFQEVGHAIKTGNPQLARIDVSKPDFLARDNLPPVVLPIWQNPPLFVVPLQQVPPQAAAAEEEIASSRLSLEEEIEKFRFDKEEGVSERPV